MKWCPAAVLILAVRLVFPCPGSAQNKTANQVQKKANDNESRTKLLVPTIPQPDASPKAQNPTPSEASANVERRVRIESPVTVNSRKDLWDKALVWCTVLIVVVGIFQIISLWRTVKATKLAANAAKDSAKVAEESLVLLNRPWLDTDEWTADNMAEGLDDKPVIRIMFNVINLSPTPARIEQIEISHVILRGDQGRQILTGQTIRQIRDVKTMVTPGSYYPVYLVTETFPPYRAEGMYIQVSGCITYKDAFHKTRRKRFSRLGHIRADKQEFTIPAGTDPEGIGWNDEEDWDKE
jgi:hypothetical protein